MISKTSEIDHKYGSNVHILSDPYLSSLLARLCSPQTFQPTINQLVQLLYSNLVKTVLNREFPSKSVSIPTRMTEAHPESFLHAQVLDPEQKTVSVNLARAGTFPSHICYDTLNHILNPIRVRQDHILAARVTDKEEHVTGTELGGAKIGGDVQDSIVLFPDPMGATGSTIISSIQHYKKHVAGTPKKFIALHLIITPEYLKNLLTAHPEVVIYAVRVDRGLSSPEVLATTPGTFWEKEKGLNHKQYIVPGGGGFGEILNNSFV